ncbi:MAG: hypothetical protein DRH23_13300 [Deltaproteobacteria bacterium]|nr:hypothetical protein [Deltaproteobacteria bacterium]MBW2546332.1 hypothetical protein [Deltaproteobacteria bacterium]MBW2717376.1 hypothetical protein [Deltaproteobacteria bacterium]RLB46054.1 MAG: hypothetical protein DRH23_13300 [Deltaproteobacteria bacterium]
MPRSFLLFVLCFSLACGSTDGGAAPSDDLEPPPEALGFQINESEFVVESGGDVQYCERFAPPERFSGRDIYLVGVEAFLPEGTHHFFMGYTTKADLDAGPCFPEGTVRPTGQGGHPGNDAKFVFGSGQGRYTTTMPEGYGTLISAGGFFQASHHVLNLGAAPISMGGKLNIWVADEDEIHHPVRTLACDNRGVDIPPNSSVIATATCTAPFDLDVIKVSSHAHQHLTLFEARRYDGENTEEEPFYTSRDWDSPYIMELDEPMHFKAGEGITYTCHFTNPTDEMITYGAGEYGEMCATINSYAYPADRPNEVPPPLGTIARDGSICNLLGPDCCGDKGLCELTDTTNVPGAF